MRTSQTSRSDGCQNSGLTVLAPSLRGALAQQGVLPVISTSSDRSGSEGTLGPGRRTLALPMDGSAAKDIAELAVTAVREYRTSQGAPPDRIVLPGVAEFRVAYPRASGAMAGRIVVVTGAAQGFGFGIAEGMARLGAHVVVADLNGPAARDAASRIGEEFPASRVLPVTMDVADLESTTVAIESVVRALGGVDVYVSNAGVVRAGGVVEQQLSDFDAVTQVNYRGYFIGVKAVTPVMAAQHAANPGIWCDIVEINSKSGLTGSGRNFAYSGSKFGGIGLTQSFALELVDSGIKVNAVCPGNFLDGPLWQDPDHGLLVQYLRAGKVPGARTVADVLAAYRSKVPMGRGCRPEDVLRAVCYAVEQQYETGQAIPVTGGQTMVH